MEVCNSIQTHQIPQEGNFINLSINITFTKRRIDLSDMPYDPE